MKAIITFLILMWVAVVFSSQVLCNEELMMKCVHCEHGELISIQDFGGAGEFFYNDRNDIFIEYNGHIYVPVLLEHREDCPYCECLQSDGRKQFNYIEVTL